MQRKPSKKTRGPNADERRFMAWVKEQLCIQCGSSGVIADHMYGSTFRHNRVLIGMWALLPLCPCCDSVKTNGSATAYKNEFGETQSESFLRLICRCPKDLIPPADVIESIEDWGR